jgi:ferritin
VKYQRVIASAWRIYFTGLNDNIVNEYTSPEQYIGMEKEIKDESLEGASFIYPAVEE